MVESGSILAKPFNSSSNSCAQNNGQPSLSALMNLSPSCESDVYNETKNSLATHINSQTKQILSGVSNNGTTINV